MQVYRTLLAFLVFLGTTACAASEEISVNNILISLNKDKCSITLNNNETKLALKPSCHFVKQGDSAKTRIEHYDDISSYVLLIVGSTVRHHPDFPMTRTRDDCGSQLQAITVSETGEITTSRLMADTITCAGVGVDEKEYWILAH